MDRYYCAIKWIYIILMCFIFYQIGANTALFRRPREKLAQAQAQPQPQAKLRPIWPKVKTQICSLRGK